LILPIAAAQTPLPLKTVNDTSSSNHTYVLWAVFLAVITVFAWLVIRDAWLCDDAFITFRVVDNFDNGFGLRWNVIDRVQVYTHPLWCLSLIGVNSLADNLPLSAVWWSVILSVAAFVTVVPRPTESRLDPVLISLLIPASKAVTEFATSGLETPLAFLLLGLLITVCGGLEPGWRPRDRWVPSLGSAIVLTRPDLVLMVGPLVLAWCARKPLRKAMPPILGGIGMIAAWEAFSFLYYGSLVPNTALAKLNTGLPFAEKAAQGLRYIGDFALRDPAGFIVLGLCLVYLVALRSNLQAGAVAGGIGLYLLYIVAIGGDFMSGRFFAAPVFFAVAEAVRSAGSRQRPRPMVIRALGVMVIALLAFRLVGFAGWIDDTVSRNGIADERRVYAPALSLAAVRDGRPVQRVSWVHDALDSARKGPSVKRAIAIGLSGYYGGPKLHILDVNALGDPLLSRLPARLGSRVGHFERRIPQGYEESLATGRLVIADPELRAFCGVVWSVTRGPVWSASRLGDSFRLISGGYDPLVAGYLSRFSAWQREPGPPALPPPDATIEMLFLPEGIPNSTAGTEAILPP
jgi:arabinofuranosyltransferase